jgi:hypothetical protein
MYTTYETVEAFSADNMIKLDGLPSHVCAAIRLLVRGEAV